MVVYEKDNSVAVKINEQREQFVLPDELKDSTHFSIVIPQKKEKNKEDSEREVANEWKEPKPDLATLLMEANHLYQKRKYKQLLSLLNKAEKFYPKVHRFKTMKGSLFYSLGWKDLARQQWNDSLGLEPNQPRVRKYIDKMGSAPIESGGKTDENNGRIPASESEKRDPFDSTEIRETIEELKKEVRKGPQEEEMKKQDFVL